MSTSFSNRPLPALERLPGREGPQLGDPLSQRDRQIVKLVSDALPNKEIAAQLGLTEATVKVYLNGIFRKMGAQSRMELGFRHLWKELEIARRRIAELEAHLA